MFCSSVVPPCTDAKMGVALVCVAFAFRFHHRRTSAFPSDVDDSTSVAPRGSGCPPVRLYQVLVRIVVPAPVSVPIIRHIAAVHMLRVHILLMPLQIGIAVMIEIFDRGLHTLMKALPLY